MIGVSNTDQSDALNGSSNYGQDVFLGAPGTGIATTSAGGGYTSITGTSASAAEVAGAAALVKANSGAVERRDRVAAWRRTLKQSGTRDQTGNGRLNLDRAVTDTSTGSVQPAGAAPVGGGGPFVGPYVVAAPQVNFDMAPTYVAGSGSRNFTLLFESQAGGGNGVGCIKVIAPAGYTLTSSAVTQALVTSGHSWNTPTVNTGTRTIMWTAVDSSNDLDAADWGRISLDATVPASSTANWTMEAWQNLTCTGGGGNMQGFLQAVRVGALADPQYSATFRDAGGAVITPSVTTGASATFRIRVTRTSGSVNVQSAFVAVPTCFTAVSAPTMVSGARQQRGVRPHRWRTTAFGSIAEQLSPPTLSS